MVAWGWGAVGEGEVGGAQEIFSGNETVLCDSVMVATRHYASGKIHRSAQH